MDCSGREYTVLRGPDGRLTLPCQLLESPGPGIARALGVGFPAGSGRSLDVLVDSGAEIPVWSIAYLWALDQVYGCPGRDVIGIGGHVPSVNSGRVIVVI